MAYERIDKPVGTGVRLDRPMMRVTPKSLVLNAESNRILSETGISRVWILWDAERCRVALKAAPPDDLAAFGVSRTKIPNRKSRQATVGAGTFLKRIGWSPPKRPVSVPADWNEREQQLEANLPPEYILTRVDAEKSRAAARGNSRVKRSRLES
jgi:hypothetical protein